MSLKIISKLMLRYNIYNNSQDCVYLFNCHYYIIVCILSYIALNILWLLLYYPSNDTGHGQKASELYTCIYLNNQFLLWNILSLTSDSRSILKRFGLSTPIRIHLCIYICLCIYILGGAYTRKNANCNRTSPPEWELLKLIT